MLQPLKHAEIKQILYCVGRNRKNQYANNGNRQQQTNQLERGFIFQHNELMLAEIATRVKDICNYNGD